MLFNTCILLFLSVRPISTRIVELEYDYQVEGACLSGDTFCQSKGFGNCSWWVSPSTCIARDQGVSTVECDCGNVKWKQRGMTFTGGKYCPNSSFGSKDSEISLQNVAALGANFVSVIVTRFQQDFNSTSIFAYPGLTETDENLRRIIKVAHSNNMEVMLKMQVDTLCSTNLSTLLPHTNESAACNLLTGTNTSCGTWRGCIGQANAPFPAFTSQKADKWFQSYEQSLLHYAQIAAEENISQFSVGCEFQGLVRFSKKWRNLISRVRAVVSPKNNMQLTYAANWGGDETQISWWDALDLIGVDAYYPLPNTNCSSCQPPPYPTLQELVRGWQQIILTGVPNGFEGI